MSGKNSTLGLFKPKKAEFFYIFIFIFKISCSAELNMKKSFIPRGLVCFMTVSQKERLVCDFLFGLQATNTSKTFLCKRMQNCTLYRYMYWYVSLWCVSF